MHSPRALISVLLTTISLITLFGCAATTPEQAKNEALLPEIDVVQVKENSDEALKLAQESKLDVQALNSKFMEHDNKLTALTEDVSSVSLAKIEELENRLSLLVEAYKELQERVRIIESRPPTVAAAEKKPAGPATFTPASAQALFGSSSEFESYQNALKIFNARDYEQAIKLFTEVLNKFPQGTYVDNSYYWIGECYYARGDYAQAIASFQKVIPITNSSKGDDAQLKIGLSYMKMGQNGLAKTEFQRLLDRYPASEYAARTKKYLGDLSK